MTQKKQVYKCEICGNIVEILHEGAGELVCCGAPMKEQQENMIDAVIEKHVPVIEKTDKGYNVSVGEDPHPMTGEHYIEWIELDADGIVYRRVLGPGDKPFAEFCAEADMVSARAYCNLHGLWKSI